MRKIEKFRVRLFWEKMISGNHFPPNPHVWLQRKMKYSGNSLPVDRNLRLWPGNEFTLSFSLQFIFGSRKTQREREKERKESPKQRPTQRKREKECRESERKNAPSDPANEWEKEWELRSSHRHRSTSRRSHRVQPDDHRAKRRRPTVSESLNSHRSRPMHPIQLSQSITGPATPITEPNTDSRWVFRNRLTVHTLTSPPTHIHPIHTLTSPVQPILPIRSLHYIYIFIFIYLYKYLYIYLIFFIY